MRKNYGFTLVEILAVVVIISILASISTVAYITVQRQARDDDRKSDVLVIKNALDKYYQDKGEYPLPGGCVANTACAITNLSAPLVPDYVDVLPVAPASGTSYQYIRNTTLDSYGIYVTPETTTACKTGANMTTTWWSSAPTCAY